MKIFFDSLKILALITLAMISSKIMGNDFSDQHIEFSMDDGDSEVSFDYEDEEETRRMQEILTRKKKQRAAKLKNQVAKEDALRRKKMLHKMRQQKLAEIQKRDQVLKQKRQEVAQQRHLKGLNDFHHMKKELSANWAHHPRPVTPVEQNAVGRSIASIPGPQEGASTISSNFQNNSNSLDASGNPSSTSKQAFQRSPQSFSKNDAQKAPPSLVQKAKNTLKSLWQSFKSFWQ